MTREEIEKECPEVIEVEKWLNEKIPGKWVLVAEVGGFVAGMAAENISTVTLLGLVEWLKLGVAGQVRADYWDKERGHKDGNDDDTGD